MRTNNYCSAAMVAARRLAGAAALAAGVERDAATPHLSEAGRSHATSSLPIRSRSGAAAPPLLCGCPGWREPSAAGFLSGMRDTTQQLRIRPFITRPRNLTPDNLTGLGRFSERQLFNAIRYGLRPGETPDVDITSSTPGQGGFPMNPKYLAIPMPWPAFRHIPYDESSISPRTSAGCQPVNNRVPDSEAAGLLGQRHSEKIGPTRRRSTATEKAP